MINDGTNHFPSAVEPQQRGVRVARRRFQTEHREAYLALDAESEALRVAERDLTALAAE